MPMSEGFKKRLFPVLEKIIEHFGTPFHVYDEAGIIETGQSLKAAFTRVKTDLLNFFAVKSNANLAILRIMKRLGFGFDCSSIPELILAQKGGAQAKEIMFTSNNTSQEEFKTALEIGCILNLDDLSFVLKVPGKFPELICFRYNPGKRRTGNVIIGEPIEAKYGLRDDQIIQAYQLAIKRGARKFGLHTMICSNQLDYRYMVETVQMLLEIVERVSAELKIKFEFVNMGGGIGIPYRLKEKPFNILALANEVERLMDQFEQKFDYKPKFYMELGRYMTGPHGVLVTRVINRMSKYKEFVGVDACCLSSVMRPAMYYPQGGYHHISVFGKEGDSVEKVNIVGPACENNDQFGRERKLPKVSPGDIILVHDTGAHCYAMASNYNARLRPQELLLRADGKIELISRAERVDDYLARMLDFEPKILSPR